MNRQRMIVMTGTACFGVKNMTSKRERALRFLEEAIELVRAAGLSREDVNTLADSEFSRPPGELEQECAGALVTLYALADVNEIDLDAVSDDEVIRILLNIDKCRAKHLAKPKGVLAA